jgi:Tfp pilus assembly protein PilF
MTLFFNKILLFSFLILFISIQACTNSPWHQQQGELFLNKGISLIEMKQFNNAAKELLQAEKYSPNNSKIHYFLGIAYDGKGMRDKAIEEFKKAIYLQDDYSEAHNYLGVLYMDMGLWDKAIKEFDQALANPLYDTPVMALYNAGLAFHSKKDNQNALRKYQEALQKEPMTYLLPQIEKNIGIIYIDKNNIHNAIEHLEKSVKLNSSLFDAYFLLGECYLRIHESEKAKRAFESVIKVAPQSSSFNEKSRNYLQSL